MVFGLTAVALLDLLGAALARGIFKFFRELAFTLTHGILLSFFGSVFGKIPPGHMEKIMGQAGEFF